MPSESTWRLSEAEVEALLRETRSDDLESIINAWPNSHMLDERPRRKEPTMDPVNPSHYKKGEIECIDAIMMIGLTATKMRFNKGFIFIGRCNLKWLDSQ